VLESWDEASCLAAIDLLDQAIARDPGYALALGLSSYIHSLLAVNLWGDNSARLLEMGRQMSARALAAGGEDAEVLAWAAAGRVQAGGDPSTVDSMMERSIALNPGLSVAWFGSGWAKLYLGQPQLASERLETALRMDPRSGFRPLSVAGLGYSDFFRRRFDDAARRLIEAAESRPAMRWWTLVGAAAAYAHLGRMADARQVLARMPPVDVDRNRVLVGLFHDPHDQELLRSGLALAGADV
jgi:tetratricopeptide (TPR) repeat protein